MRIKIGFLRWKETNMVRLMRAWYFARDSAILDPPERRAQLIRFFEKAAEYNDTRAVLLSQRTNKVLRSIFGPGGLPYLFCLVLPSWVNS